MLDPQLATMWCDGLIPERYLFDGRQPRITGRAWLGATGQEPWTFTLFLHTTVKRREEIDWAAHYPPENTTCWIAVDVTSRRIQFEPAAAVPNLK